MNIEQELKLCVTKLRKALQETCDVIGDMPCAFEDVVGEETNQLIEDALKLADKLVPR